MKTALLDPPRHRHLLHRLRRHRLAQRRLDGRAEHRRHHAADDIFRGNDETHLGTGHGNWNNTMGFELSLASLTGLSIADIKSTAANVQFAMSKPAGTISFEGRFSNGNGAGNFKFAPSEPFVREMASLGYTAFKDDDLLVFATTDFSPQTVRDLRALGYQPTQKEIEEVAIFQHQRSRHQGVQPPRLHEPDAARAGQSPRRQRRRRVRQRHARARLHRHLRAQARQPGHPRRDAGVRPRAARRRPRRISRRRRPRTSASATSPAKKSTPTNASASR